MEHSILTPARAEQQALEIEIAAIDAEYAAYAVKKKSLVQRLDAVKALRAAYGDYTLVSGLSAIANGLSEIGTALIKAQSVRENSHKARVISTSVEILKGGISMPTKHLLDQLEKRGIQFNAANKAGNLSVLLSKDNRFVSDRRSGWSLTDRGPQDVEASAGLSKAEAVSQSIAPPRV